MVWACWLLGGVESLIYANRVILQCLIHALLPSRVFWRSAYSRVEITPALAISRLMISNGAQYELLIRFVDAEASSKPTF